jgi:hypothetical protein
MLPKNWALWRIPEKDFPGCLKICGQFGNFMLPDDFGQIIKGGKISKFCTLVRSPKAREHPRAHALKCPPSGEHTCTEPPLQQNAEPNEN